ncbi:MAG: ribonuclease P protein component [Saprospiraceae bacterium]|nr:ribonuclease P protein component [Saprospiraceae bacterium]
MKEYGFPKNEKLKSRSLIEQLFREGKSHFMYPVKWAFLELKHDEPKATIQFSVSVSKRIFKKAVDRNLIKRRIREAYRLQKSELVKQYTDEGRSFVVMAIYVGKIEEPYETIERAVRKLLKKGMG